MKKLTLIVLAWVIVPGLALAASGPSLGNLQTLLSSIGKLVSMALPIVAGLALLAFFWGLAKYIFAADDEKKKGDGKRLMIMGVIALAVMVSVWGLVRFLGTAFGIDQEAKPDVLPSVPGLPATTL